jgi:hypothetical protein
MGAGMLGPLADSNLDLLFSDNCQSSGLYGSVESSQVKLGGVFVECGLSGLVVACGMTARMTS